MESTLEVMLRFSPKGGVGIGPYRVLESEACGQVLVELETTPQDDMLSVGQV